MSRKITIVKKNLAPAPKPPGVNPRDPWSSFSEASEEQLLMRYLNSRGINPNFVSKDTKISHSKSSEFLKWKNDHQFQEQVIYEAIDEKDMVCFDIPLLIRVLEFTREEMKTDIELHNMVERLINMRHDVPLDMTHYDEITQKLMKENHIAIAMGKMLDDESGMVLSQIEELERGCAMIRSYVGKDYEKQLPAWVQAKVTLATDYMSTVGNYLVSKNEKVNEEAESIDEGVYTDDESIAKHLVQKYGKNVDSHQIRLAHHFHPEKHKTTPQRIANHVNRLLGRPVTEEEELEEGVFTDDESIAKHLVKKYGKNVQSHDIKLAMHFHPEPHKTSLDRIAGHVKRLVGGPKPVTEDKMPKPTALDKFRKASAEREKKHNETEKNSGNMTSAIDRLQKHLNKESSEFMKDVKKKVAATKSDRYTHYSKTSKDMPNTADTYAQMAKHQKQLAKEDVEQIDEISKSTLNSYRDKSTASMKNAQANRDAAEPGKNMSKGFANLHAKSDAIANKRVKGLIGYMQRKQGMKPTSEDIYQDSQAATQTVFDGANNTDDTTMGKKREMSKSARMIKALYKKHKMVKEDMYDHEKEDKSVQTYGKKPKIQKPDEENNKGEDKPAALMSGGTTLTGEKRDDVEIDPMMKNRPGQNQFNKEFGKKGS
jgi:hypothetical protein